MACVYRFGVFLFDRDQLTLTRDGLAALVEHAGQVVAREELRKRFGVTTPLWISSAA